MPTSSVGKGISTPVLSGQGSTVDHCENGGKFQPFKNLLHKMLIIPYKETSTVIMWAKYSL